MKVELLQNDGKKKTFQSGPVLMRSMREFLELQTRINLNSMDADELDEFVGFVCRVFGNQFTIDDFYDGMPVDKLNTFSQTFALEIMGAKGVKTDEKKSSPPKKTIEE